MTYKYLSCTQQAMPQVKDSDMRNTFKTQPVFPSHCGRLEHMTHIVWMHLYFLNLTTKIKLNLNMLLPFYQLKKEHIAKNAILSKKISTQLILNDIFPLSYILVNIWKSLLSLVNAKYCEKLLVNVLSKVQLAPKSFERVTEKSVRNHQAIDRLR